MATTGEPFGLFWDSESGDRTYSAASFEYWLKKFFTSGVFNGDLQVNASSGMTLEIEPGYANVDGKVKFWNGAFTLTLNAANSTYPRIDTIVITRDNVNRQIVCEVVTGSYSGDTPQPTAPVRNSEIYQLVLAQIYVGAGVTGITQANITDTRPDNTLCGWITGTVEELDFSQFTAQFEQYFREFKADAEGDYESWFNEVQSEQIEDKEAWDAWYAALREELHNLPADSAEYLQIQIDELKESGLSGSIFKITTINPSLEGKTVRIINADNTEEKTGTFDSNLECVIYGMKSVGEITITSTDGIQTATSVISIPYFGNYTVPIAFWAATVNMQGDTNLYGATITIKDSDNLTVGTVVLSAIDGTGTFTASKADTYTFNFTYQGTSYSEELVVSEETTYSISLSAGFSWRIWVDTASKLDSSDYASLAEVLADEEAVRELFTEHACVDYMAESTTSNADLETIINDDYCAKWINNSDYALDFLGANTVIKALMDEADKYGYGEWVIIDNTTTPPTWGAKGNVPVMTGTTTPYGTTSASSVYSGRNSYNAFDGNDSTIYSTAADHPRTSFYLQYDSVNPINLKGGKINAKSNHADYYYDVVLMGSNDGSTWTTLTETLRIQSADYEDYSFVSIGDTNYYKTIKMTCEATNAASMNSAAGALLIHTLQFYGRELKASVPKMTSNTAPFGEASASSVLETQYLPWRAFDGDESGSSLWVSNNTVAPNVQQNAWLQYKFVNPICVKKIRYVVSSTIHTDSMTILGSNDGINFETIDTLYNVPTGASVHNINNENEYLYYRFNLVQHHTQSGSINIPAVRNLQLYGSDYSEKEFEEGTTKMWLYDHGLELETLDKYKGSNTTSQIAYNDGNSLVFDALTPSNNGYTYYNVVGKTVDLTNYSLLRAIIGNVYIGRASDGTNSLRVYNADSIPSSGNYANNNAVASVTDGAIVTNPITDFAVDLSNLNGNKWVSVGVWYYPGLSMSITEFWLE